MDAFDDGNLPAVTIEGSATVLPTPHAQAQSKGADGFNDRQRAFIDAYCANGGNGKEAAIAAGYGGGAENMAMRNLLKPKFQAEIERRVRAGKGTALLKAMSRLFSIIENSTDDRAAVQAALGVADRFGMAPPKGPLIDARTVNIGAGEVQSILADVVAKRQARLARQSDG